MVRRYALLVVGVVALSGLSWWAVDQTEPEPAPRPTPPSQVDTLIAFCAKPGRDDNPLCKVDPSDPEAVDRAIREAVPGSRIIERERLVEGDDDDEQRAPDVRVIVPTARPTSRPSTPAPTQTTRPPLAEIPELPVVPEVEVPDLPLPLPLP
jgi:hypothetical protein